MLPQCSRILYMCGWPLDILLLLLRLFPTEVCQENTYSSPKLSLFQKLTWPPKVGLLLYLVQASIIETLALVCLHFSLVGLSLSVAGILVSSLSSMSFLCLTLWSSTPLVAFTCKLLKLELFGKQRQAVLSWFHTHTLTLLLLFCPGCSDSGGSAFSILTVQMLNPNCELWLMSWCLWLYCISWSIPAWSVPTPAWELDMELHLVSV
jgi:hypothetical protein